MILHVGNTVFKFSKKTRHLLVKEFEILRGLVCLLDSSDHISSLSQN